MSKVEKSKVSVRNRKAEFEFEILAKYIAGMVLAGSEIKSIRNHKASIAEAYCAFAGDELVIRNMNIEEYSHSTYFNHEPRRDRKLLLQKSELNKLRTKLKDKGLTIVPLHLFISDSGYAKVEIALAKGKKLYDKRESLKDKDLKRNLSRSDAFRD